MMNAKEKKYEGRNNLQHRKGRSEQCDSFRKEQCKLKKQPGRDSAMRVCLGNISGQCGWN